METQRRKRHIQQKTISPRTTGSYKLLGLLVFLAGVLFAFLLPSKQNTQPPFMVVELPGKGKGIIATRDIKQGELLIREKPLFTLPKETTASPLDLLSEQLSKLLPAQRDEFFNLSYVHLPTNLSPEEPDYEAQVALAITQTNAISAGDQGIGLFPAVARLNHGCSAAFNSIYSWREQERVLVVHALKPIKKGDELLTTYTDTKRPRDERRAYLLANYAFRCTCSVCSLPSDLSRRSDERLTKMSELHHDLSSWTGGRIEGGEATSIISKIWAIGDQEGYLSERGSLAADAVWVAAAHSDARAAREWAHRAVEWYSYELGKDSIQVNEMTRYVGAPQLHPSWATRRKAAV